MEQIQSCEMKSSQLSSNLTLAAVIVDLSSSQQECQDAASQTSLTNSFQLITEHALPFGAEDLKLPLSHSRLCRSSYSEECSLIIGLV